MERLDLRGSLRRQVQRWGPEAGVGLPDANGGKDESFPRRWPQSRTGPRSGRSSDPFTGKRPAPMSGTEIRQLGPRDASEYQAIFLEALRSAPEAFAADYEEESARSLEEVVERFQREGIYGGVLGGEVPGSGAVQRRRTRGELQRVVRVRE